MIRVIRETHHTPADVAAVLCAAGGVNRFGEPNYRAVWGWNRLTWIGGKWEDRNAAGELLREVVQLREEPKYAPFDRWHIERWMPPESYGSPREWYRQTIERVDGLLIPALGPYPWRGEYEHCFTLSTPGGRFVQLTAEIARYVARAIEFSRGTRPAERKESLVERMERQEREYDARDEAILNDSGPAFSGVIHSIGGLKHESA